MRATVRNANIRGVERKTNQKGGEYLLVRYEDETGKPETVVDKDMGRQVLYGRDVVGDIVISIDIGKYTTIRVMDFITSDSRG